MDKAGIDIALVGDSAAMVVHGRENTLSISLDEIISHCKAVKRGSTRALIVADIPFGFYESNIDLALSTAFRLVKEGGVDAVKLEGATATKIQAVKSMVEAGIAVVGHVGLTPHSVGVLGGFRPQGKTANSALQILDAAYKLQEAGCFAVVLECVPKALADKVTAVLQIPTIGIGAGSGTSGQVLVFHDLLGFLQHPHHRKVSPKFCKQYAHVGESIHVALSQFVSDVSARKFPDDRHTPYEFERGELDKFNANVSEITEQFRSEDDE